MFCRQAIRWLYRAERNFIWESGIGISEDQVFKDERGKVRLIIETTGRMTVTRGYSWNGCSPKVCLFDLLLGTPDGVVDARTGRPKTYYASMLHDALYQFLRVDSPISRRQADRCFLRLMAESDFRVRNFYWVAVRMFGRLVWYGKRIKREWHGERILVADVMIRQPTPDSTIRMPSNQETYQEAKSPATTEQRKARPTSTLPYAVTALLWLSASAVAGAISIVLISDQGVTESRMLFAIVVSGAVGAALQGSQALITFIGNRTYQPSWTGYFVLRPIIGAASALIIYVLMRGTFVSSGLAVSSLNYYGVVGIAFLAGIFSRNALVKLTEVFDAVAQRTQGGRFRGIEPQATLPTLDRYEGFLVHELKTGPDPSQRTLRIWFQSQQHPTLSSVRIAIGEGKPARRVVFGVNVFSEDCDLETRTGQLAVQLSEEVPHELTFVLTCLAAIVEPRALVEVTQRGRTVAVIPVGGGRD